MRKQQMLACLLSAGAASSARPSAALLLAAHSKNQKSLEALLGEINYSTNPRYNSRAVCGAHLALRGEILQLHELRRQVSRCHDVLWGGGAHTCTVWGSAAATIEFC
jgi:hypothetical protein